jgi:hypothetical protein
MKKHKHLILISILIVVALAYWLVFSRPAEDLYGTLPANEDAGAEYFEGTDGISEDAVIEITELIQGLGE